MDLVEAGDLWEVRLEVYVIGYSPEGEAILILITEGNRILHSILTDCYRTAGSDCISSILNKYENPRIDWFVWTHPHEDHSVAISETLEGFDSRHDCHIFIPNNLHAVDQGSLSKIPLRSREYLRDNYNQKGNVGPRRRRRYHVVDFDPDAECPRSYRFEIVDRSIGDKIPVMLTVLGPDNVEALKNSDGIVGLVENALSVVYTLDVNGLVVFMAGDVNKNGSKVIPDDYFANFHLLKIPHHCSNEPESFYNRMSLNEIKESIGITKIFAKRNLPQSKALAIYKNSIGSVYVTQATDNGVDYGYVHVRYKPMDMTLESAPSLYGNAGLA